MWPHSVLDSLTSAARRARAGRRPRAAARKGRLTTRSILEALEDRCLLSFLPAATYNVGTGPLAVATADFNNDGKLDLVVANQNPSNSLSVLLGDGDGTFQPSINVALGFSPRSVAVGDFNTDGKIDAVVVGDSHVAELLGNGDGTFQPPLALVLPGQFPPGYTGTTPLSQDPLSVAVGDLNSEGKLDLAVTAKTSFFTPSYYGQNYYQNGYVNVLLGNGDGSFSATKTTPLATTNPVSVAVADLNGDHNPDVVIAEGDASSLSVFLGNGDGSLQTPTSFSTGTGGNPVSVTVGDVNGDGKLDLVTANNYTPTSPYQAGGSVSVLLGNGNGAFQPALNVVGGPNPQSVPQSVAVSDFNKDGKADLAVVNGSGVTLLLGKGDSSFQPALSYAAGTGPCAETVGDFSRDGFPDLAVADQGAWTYDPGIGYVNSDSGLSVLLNGADWSTFGAPTNYTVSGFPSTITAGVPGAITVTVRDGSGNTVPDYRGTVHFTSSDGQAGLPADYTFTAADGGIHTFSAALKTAGSQSITATDITTASVTGSETGITVTGAAASHLAVWVPADRTAGSPSDVVVTALDPYNNRATGYTGTVHFTSTDGQASLPGDYTFTAADFDIHDFVNGMTLKTAGSETVTASDTAASAISGSAAVTVKPAAASTMSIAGFPSLVTAGIAGSVTVRLLDPYGNTATGYTGTVRFNSSDAAAALPANYTFTAADAGLHTFSATLKTAGTQSITATDTTMASLTGTEGGITVNPAAASHFLISAPPSVTAGVPFSLTVTVEDAYGNIVTGYVGTVHFTSGDGSATLPADYTFTASDKGVHTFTGLVLRKKSKRVKITVTDTLNSSVSGSVSQTVT